MLAGAVLRDEFHFHPPAPLLYRQQLYAGQGSHVRQRYRAGKACRKQHSEARKYVGQENSTQTGHTLGME